MKKRTMIWILSTMLMISLAVVCWNGERQNGGDRNVEPTPFDADAVLLAGNQWIITVEGSTSVAGLLEILAESFMDSHPGLKIDIMANGTNAAIKAVINRNTDLGMVSRQLHQNEKIPPMKEIPIAWDVLAVIVHPENGVEMLSKKQVAMIYRRQIKNWKTVGGEDKPIHIISREEGSGTQKAFQSLFDVEPIPPEAQICDGNGAVMAGVAGKINAIGYVSFGFINEKVKPIGIDGVFPSKENAADGRYALKRPFILIYREDNDKEVLQKFIGFIKSEKARQLISEQYVPFAGTQ